MCIRDSWERRGEREVLEKILLHNSDDVMQLTKLVPIVRKADVHRAMSNTVSYTHLEIGYGINLRPLTTFAERFYGNDPCEHFKPKVFDENKYDPVGAVTAAKMNKAIAICQFKACLLYTSRCV